jgi:dCTP deaminase
MFFSRQEILEAVGNGSLIVEPFEENLVGPASLSLRLGREAFTLTTCDAIRVDVASTYPTLSPRMPDAHGYFALDPGEVLLMPTLEKIGIARTLCGMLSGTSDLARLGIGVALSTFVGPGFSFSQPGALTLELTSFAPQRVLLLDSMRACHLILGRVPETLERERDESPYEGSSSVGHSRLFERLFRG